MEFLFCFTAVYYMLPNQSYFSFGPLQVIGVKYQNIVYLINQPHTRRFLIGFLELDVKIIISKRPKGFVENHCYANFRASIL